MKNKLLNALLNIFRSGCVIFTFVVFGFYILGDLMSSQIQVLTLKNLFLLLLFSLWFAMSNIFLKNKKLNIILRTILHFVSTVFGFFVIFIYLPGNLENGSSAFVLTIGFAALYILVASIIFTVNHIMKKKKADTQEYKSVYEKTKQD